MKRASPSDFYADPVALQSKPTHDFKFSATQKGLQHQQQRYFCNTTDFPGQTLTKVMTQEDLAASQFSEISSYRPQDIQRQLAKEMHLMIDDLELPNTSMTISSLSQSPWQGTKSTQSYLSNLTSQRLTNQNEGGDSARNEALIDSQNKSKHELQNFIGSSLSSSEYNEFKSNRGAARTMGSKQPFQHEVKAQVRSPRTFDEKRGGSPDFAKELISVTDDLTVSHTDEDVGDGTYRGPGFQDTLGQEPFGLRNNLVRNQNRTFADSVLNHHANQLQAKSRDLKGKSDVKRISKSRYEASSKNDDLDGEEDIERDDGRPSNATINNDLDQISDLDQLLTQTQMSNNLMRLGGQTRSEFTRSHMTTADQNQLSRRTNMFKKMEDAESLSFTPDKGPMGEGDFADSESQNWFGQKSYIGGHKTDRISDQSSVSIQVNPVSKLKAKIKEQTLLKKGPQSKGIRDQELEKALEFTAQPPSILVTEQVQVQVASIHAQEVEALKAQVQLLAAEKQKLQAELDRKPQPQNELLRARALEAARQEIRELQETVELQKTDLERVQAGRHQQDEAALRKQEALQAQIKSLSMELDKQKIIISSHKRDIETSQKAANDASNSAETEIAKVREECELKIKPLIQKISLLEKTLKQYEAEYNQKADELDENILVLEQKDKALQDLESRFIQLQQECSAQKQRAIQLEQDLEQVSKQNKDTNDLNAESTMNAYSKQASSFDAELQALKQTHAKEMTKLKEDLGKHKELLQQARQKSISLQEQLDSNQDDESHQVLLLLKDRLGLPQEQDVDEMVASLIEVHEANRLMERELESAANQLKHAAQERQALEEALLKAEKAHQREIKLAGDSQFSMQMMLAKDQEIAGLRQIIEQRESEIQRLQETAMKQEDSLWDVQAELKVARAQFQTQASELQEVSAMLKDAKARQEVLPSLLIKAVLALDLGGEQPSQIVHSEQSALEHLQLYTRQQIQQSLQANKKSMAIEQELSQHKMKTQEMQIEMDFQIRENQRIKELLQKLERGQKQTTEQETQCSYQASQQTVQTEGTQTDHSTSAKSSQTILDVDNLMVHNESLTAQLSHQTQLIAELQAKLEASGHGLSQSQVKRDLEQFKSQIQVELKDKTSQLDQAYLEIEQERKQLELDYLKRQNQLQADFEARLNAQRVELENKMAQQASAFEQREFELNTKLSNTAEQPQTQVSKLTKDLAKLQVQLRDKDRECKRLAQEADKLKKTHAEQLQQLQETTEELAREKIEEHSQKAKAAKEKGIEKAVEKVRIELRNQLESQKNEFAKAKADWQRERKKANQEHEEALAQLQKDAEATHESDLRQVKEAKERADKQWKKRLEDQQAQFEARILELTTELAQTREKHLAELKMLRESKANDDTSREALTIQMRQDLCEQLSKEFASELAKANVRHAEELAGLKAEYERQLKQERLINMPLQREPISPQNMTQDSHLIQLKSPTPREGVFKSSKVISQAETSYSCMCSEVYQRRQEETEQYIEQLKQTFEQELNRQEALNEDKQRNQTLVATKLMERLVLLECDKILQLIQFKQSQTSPKPLSMNDVNRSRNHINDVIKDILTQSGAMKPSFDKIKLKLSEVLASLKAQIETKYSKQLAELQASNQDKDLQLRSLTTTIQVSETNLVTDRPKLASLGYATLGNESMEQIEHCECHGNQRCQNCLSSPKFKFGQATLKASNETTTDLVIQSRDFVTGYLKPAHQRSDYSHVVDDEVIIRGSTQDIEDDRTRAQFLLDRLAPNKVNAQGAIVVEVEKVVRDLLMLHRTVKSAKFYRVLIGSAVFNNIDLDDDSLLNEQDQSKLVSTYRELLNHFFKVIVKLNAATDDLTQNNEVYKLKLLNLDLKQQVADLRLESQGTVTRQKVEEILSYYQRVTQRFELQPSTKDALEALESIQFSISKHQLKLNQLADLFSSEGQVNRDIEAVEARCHEFSVQGGEQLLESTLNVRKSQQQQWHADQHNLSAEMLSPDETANLLANIMQKMQRPPLNQTQQMLPHHMLPDVSVITDAPVTPQELLKQALILCQNQSTQLPHSLSPQTQMYHQNSTFSHFTQPGHFQTRPKNYSQMPLQMLGGLPPKRKPQVTKSYNESIQRSRSLSSNSKQQQQFITLQPNSMDSTSQHSGYMPQHVQVQSQSIDYQSHQMTHQNPFSSIDSNHIHKSYLTGANLRPPNPKKRSDVVPGMISSSLSAAKLRQAGTKNLPLQPGSKERYKTEDQGPMPSWLNNT